MSDPLTPKDQEALRRWATGQATKLGRQLRALLAERDRLEQELDVARMLAVDLTAERDVGGGWLSPLRLNRTAARLYGQPWADKRFPATHPAEEPEETPP